MSDYEIERLNDIGLYQRYIVTLKGERGEILSLPRFVDGGISEMLNELSRFLSRPN